MNPPERQRRPRSRGAKALLDVNMLVALFVFQPAYIQGHRQLTDVYLLALAVANQGRLVTFDQSVPLKAVIGAEPLHLEVIGGAPTDEA